MKTISEMRKENIKKDFIVENFMKSNGLYCLVARPKVGKSLLALQLANAIATGTNFLGFRTSPSPVLYISTEMNFSQILDRIEYVHSRKIIHRDIKPDNFSIGYKNKSHIIYILDFGLAKKYWSTSHKSHIPYIEGKKLTGTARYASINALGGCEQSRRDDLESIFYILIYFLKGRLPWQGLKANKKEDRYKKIYEVKKSVKIKDLCSGFPEEFESFYNYVRKLEFEQVPDYDYLKSLLKIILAKNNYIIDYFYDWDKEKPNISKDDSVFKNNYNIKYNGNEEWLIKTKNTNDDYNIEKK